MQGSVTQQLSVPSTAIDEGVGLLVGRPRGISGRDIYMDLGFWGRGDVP